MSMHWYVKWCFSWLEFNVFPNIHDQTYVCGTTYHQEPTQDLITILHAEYI